MIEYRYAEEASGSLSRPNWLLKVGHRDRKQHNRPGSQTTTTTVPIVLLRCRSGGGQDRHRSGAAGRQSLGLASLGSELVGKRLELLKQAIPGVSQVAVLWLPGALGERTEKTCGQGADVASRAIGVRLQFVEARGPADLTSFLGLTSARGALTLLPSNMFLKGIDASWTWRPRTGCRRCMDRGNLSMPGA